MKRFILTVILSLMYLYFSFGTAIATEFRINTYTTGNQMSPSLAYDGTNYLVTWYGWATGDSNSGIYGQIISKSGEKVGSEFHINTYTTSNQQYSSLAFDGANYLVTWSSFGQDTSDYGIYGQVIGKNGAKVGSEFRINTYTTSGQTCSSLAYDGTNYLVTWQSSGQDSGNSGIYGQMIGKNGAKIGQEFRINTHTPDEQINQSIAYGGTNYLVTWSSNWQDGNRYGIYGQLVNTLGSKVGSEFLINTYTTNDQRYPSLAFDGANYLITWCGEGQGDNTDGIYGQLINTAGSKVGSEFLINTYTLNSQYNPKLAFDGTNYLVTWESSGQDGSGWGIYGQRINSAGEKVGSEFLINTYTTGYQYSSALATDGTNFFVAWQSDGQDGSNYGIYGDFVAGNPPVAVPEPLSVILFGCGIFFLNRRFASRK